MTLAPEEVKACCAAVYGSAAARYLLGDSFHPGGPSLTAELAAALRVGPGDEVVDVASGPGTSAIQLARQTGCTAIGVDLAPVPDPADEPRVRFVRGDAEALPFAGASVDGVLCECAFCTFPNKEQAASELARVLRSGRWLALSDMTAEPARLPPELTGLRAWVACVADARPLPEISELLARAGFEIERAEQRDQLLLELLDRIDARLQVAAMLSELVSPDAVAQGRTLVAAARQAIVDRALGYAIVVARRR
ncbi:MAG TPA: methyltransferase domain-containing protein [Gaiellaceae bacterium]|nr:methyltransferase domain-containing protein [Gaiellaceae bacterium]